MANKISALIASGADAFKNMYDVSIQFPWNQEDIVLTVRATNFENPAPKVKTYPKTYHGVKIEAIAPEQEFERKFSLTFRLDASYNIYGQFVTWFSTVGDIVTGGVANWAPIFGTVKVTALGGAYSATNEPTLADSTGTIEVSDTNPQWVYKNVAVIGVEQPKFDTGSSEAITFTVDFIFGETTAPFFASTGITGTNS